MSPIYFVNDVLVTFADQKFKCRWVLDVGHWYL